MSISKYNLYLHTLAIVIMYMQVDATCVDLVYMLTVMCHVCVYHKPLAQCHCKQLHGFMIDF